MELTGNVAGIIKLLGGGEGSTVTIEPLISSGLQIAKVTIDGDELYLYIPTPQDVSIDPVLLSGTKIAEITVNNDTIEIYAPSPTNVNVTPAINSGTKIADISVNGVNTELYAPNDEIIYSTTEKIVGKWIDNRNVYERTFFLSNLNITSRSVYVLDANLTNSYIDVLMKKCASYKISEYTSLYTDTVGSQPIGIGAASNGLYLENFSDFTITDILLTIQYVKI